MAIAVYNSQTNQVRTFMRDDYPAAYTPPAGYTLVEAGELPPDWALEEDTSHAAHLATLRASAKALLDRQQSQELLLRATILVLIDEINALRQWIAGLKSQTAAATNLANFQTRVASLPNMPDRTGAQARAAIGGKIDAAEADT